MIHLYSKEQLLKRIELFLKFLAFAVWVRPRLSLVAEAYPLNLLLQIPR